MLVMVRGVWRGIWGMGRGEGGLAKFARDEMDCTIISGINLYYNLVDLWF